MPFLDCGLQIEKNRRSASSYLATDPEIRNPQSEIRNRYLAAASTRKQLS